MSRAGLAVDPFTSADTVSVAYVSPGAGRAVAVRDELAYVLAAAAVALPHASKLEAQRYVGERPQAQARIESIGALDVVAGKQPYPAWVRGVKVEPLAMRDAILRSA